MSSREQAIEAIRESLDGRRLLWYGIRGEDGEPLLSIPELSASLAITAKLRSASIDPDSNIALEDIAGVRPDLDSPGADLPGTLAASEFRRRLLREVSSDCVVMTYRPARLTSSVAYAMSDSMTLAAPQHDRQRAFENKPWVETELKRLGVRGLNWRYVADEYRARVRREAGARPLVLRVSRSSGGVGIARAESGEAVEAGWPHDSDEFVAVATYLADATPVNFSGVVFPNGELRLHPPSVQLVGIRSCTDRPFGYCGNDFAAAAALDTDLLTQLDDLGETVGAWLHRERYAGAFGVDALLHDGNCHFTEINPRFQGSSSVSAEIGAELDEPDLYLDHLSAWIGKGPVGEPRSLRWWAEHQSPRAQIVVHNTGERCAFVAGNALPTLPSGMRLSQMPPEGVGIEHGASLGRLGLRRRVTGMGYDLDAESEAQVASIVSAYARAGVPA